MEDLQRNEADPTPLTCATAPASPNWDLVPFDVSCARCGHDLHGLTEPVCPACKLEFDWSVAVPIEKLTCENCDYHLYGLTETRCPECGTDFTWKEALDAYYRKKKSLFEYRWRDGPIRWFVRTWFMTLRPKRFWSRLDMHDPPRVRPLLLFGAAATVVFFLSMIVFFTVSRGVVKVIAAYRWNGLWYWSELRCFPSYLLEAIRNPTPYLFVEHVALWWCCSMLALLVFQQSMRQCKLRTAHVVRITVYAQFAMLPVAVAAHFTATALDDFRLIRLDDLQRWSILVPAVFVLWSIRCGYAHYAKMKHAMSVAIASQLMALLALDTVGGLIHGRAWGGRLLMAACHVLGIPL